jgi:hypothetical protein
LLLMGESGYASDGYVPTPDDTSDHPDWVIENWDNPNERVSKTFKCIMRALTNCKNPTRERMVEAWRAVGYANYVDEPMPSVEHRPKTRQLAGIQGGLSSVDQQASACAYTGLRLCGLQPVTV